MSRGGSGAKAPLLAARPEEVPVASLTYSNIEARVDRPKSAVRVIRGVATVHVSHAKRGVHSKFEEGCA